MAKRHHYEVRLDWSGQTRDYRSYARNHTLAVAGKPALLGSADPAFRGDAARWNPEELLVGALSSCHMLWYLHLCAEAGVTVTRYRDSATGEMVETARGGEFQSVTLKPEVRLAPGSDQQLAQSLHGAANAACFIARSVNFPVHHEPTCLLATHD